MSVEDDLGDQVVDAIVIVTLRYRGEDNRGRVTWTEGSQTLITSVDGTATATSDMVGVTGNSRVTEIHFEVTAMTAGQLQWVGGLTTEVALAP